MWKFVRGKSQHLSLERQKLQKELFAFRKTVQHGFPNKPTAIAWDPELRIIAIGTATGAIKVYGKNGVEFYSHPSQSDYAITKLHFVENEGRLISLSEDNSLRLWEVTDSGVEELKSFVMEGKLKKISSLCVEKSKVKLLVGTEGGNVYFVCLSTFKISEKVIYQDVVMQNVPEGYKINPGAVEIIVEQPNHADNLLIGYSRGLMVLWKKTNSEALRTYVNNQQLENLCWNDEGTKFVSSHNDGSYIFWSVDSSEPQEEPITVYGPFPCKSITKILWPKSSNSEGDDFVIFSGGMPRASFGDRHTVTVQRGTDEHVVFDFTSKVIDFFTTNDRLNDGCEALIIMLEEEMVAVDLTSEEWRTIPLPYLISLHASSVTFLTYVSDVSPKVWNDILASGKQQIQETVSSLEWPIDGGVIKTESNDENTHRDILITGHEDGSVRFWNAGTIVLSLIYIFKSSSLFSADDELFEDDIVNNQADEDDEWPPFRKVGCFDPYVDDPRFSIKKVCFCGISGTLMVAGAAGQVVVCGLEENAAVDRRIKVSTMNLIPEKEGFEEVAHNWKGFQRLSLKGNVAKDETVMSLTCGFQPICVVQLLPPTAVTALALHTAWNVLAVGTAYGIALYDYQVKSPILYRCTLNAADFSTLNEPPISRTKSFKKSLRESFRRIRKGRTSVRHHEKQRSTSKSPISPVSPASTESRRIGNNESASCSTPTVNSLETKPVERPIEARSTDDAVGNMVRCLCFARTNIINGQILTPSLWAGTNNGTVYIFTMTIPAAGKRRNNEKVHAQLGKEIQLKHRAPVVAIALIDGANKLIPETIEVEQGVSKPADNSAPHHVIICSEEQFKIFSLPNLKPTCKLKLTAMEGAKIRRMNLALFRSANHAETCLVCLTNLGECIVLSLPDLRRLVTAAVIKREDINGISSFIFTKWGEGLYLHSSSEIQRITLSASRKIVPRCALKSNANNDSKQTFAFLKEKPNSVLNNSNVIGEIPEEDEEQQEETEPRNNRNKKGFVYNVKKSAAFDDENQQPVYNHDVSAITVDSVKDHLNSINGDEISHCHAASSEPVADIDVKKQTNDGELSETDISQSSANTTIENSATNVSTISESRIEVRV